ncbi:MAG: transposase, partial [Candidatus Eremiobacteraeota bacterium]|nr:transposase [Candidatus Eremiobacteraeota bacterium]
FPKLCNGVALVTRLVQEIYQLPEKTYRSEVPQVLDSWHDRYNTARPHKALGWQTPEEFASSFAISRTIRNRHLSSAA